LVVLYTLYLVQYQKTKNTNPPITAAWLIFKYVCFSLPPVRTTLVCNIIMSCIYIYTNIYKVFVCHWPQPSIQDDAESGSVVHYYHNHRLSEWNGRVFKVWSVFRVIFIRNTNTYLYYLSIAIHVSKVSQLSEEALSWNWYGNTRTAWRGERHL